MRVRAMVLRAGGGFSTATLLASVALWSQLAQATPRYTLEWQAPVGCPDGAAARSSIDGLLGDGPDPDPDPDPAVHAEVVITAVDGGHRLALRLSQAEGVREIDAPTCEELTETAAVIVAIAIDPGVLARVMEPEPAAPPPADADAIDVAAPPVPTAPSILAPLGAADPPTTTPRRRPRPPVAIVTFVAGPDVGTLPRISGRFGAWAGPAWRDATLEVGGEYVVRRPVPSSDSPRVDAQVQAWSLGARGCYSRHEARVGFGLCGSFRAGAVHAGGGVALDPRSGRRPWIGLGPGVMLLVAVRPQLAVTFGLDLLYTALRGGFRTESSGTVALPWPITFQAAVGIRWRALMDPRPGGQPKR